MPLRAERARDDRVRGGLEDGGGGCDVPVSGGALASAGPAPALPRLLGRDQPARQVRAYASYSSTPTHVRVQTRCPSSLWPLRQGYKIFYTCYITPVINMSKIG